MLPQNKFDERKKSLLITYMQIRSTILYIDRRKENHRRQRKVKPASDIEMQMGRAGSLGASGVWAKPMGFWHR